MRRRDISMIAAVIVAMTLVSCSKMTAEEAMVDIETKIANVDTFRANMDMSVDMLGEKMTFPSTIVFKKPDKLRMESTIPMAQDMKQIMVFDGETSWTYIPTMNVVTKTGVGQKGEMPQGTSSFPLSDPAKNVTKPFEGVEKDLVRFLGKKYIDEQEAYVFDMQMSSKGMPQIPFMPHRMQMWIGVEDGLLRKVLTFNKEDREVMSYALSDVEINVDIPDSEFTFTPPADAQIIDMTQASAKMMKAMRQPKQTEESVPETGDEPGE